MRGALVLACGLVAGLIVQFVVDTGEAGRAHRSSGRGATRSADNEASPKHSTASDASPDPRGGAAAGPSKLRPPVTEVPLAEKRSASEKAREIRLWLRLAEDALQRKEFALAIQQAARVLVMDPSHRQADLLIQEARASRRGSFDGESRRESRREEFNRSWRETMDRLDTCSIGGAIEVLNYPEDWASISRTR